MPPTQRISFRAAAAAAVVATALLTGAGAAGAAPDRQPAPTPVTPHSPQSLLHHFVTEVIGQSTGSQCSFDTRPDCGK